MNLSYAICACNEYIELGHLLNFLERVRNHDTSEVIVLVDTSHEDKRVRDVLKEHANVRVIERAFDGDFAEHKNFLNKACKGNLIFNIDADEIPQETLIKAVEELDVDDFDVLYIPRINICPGYTDEFIKTHKFNVNEIGWINWPDFQGRIYPRNKKWVGKVHERIEGSRVKNFSPQPNFALWHIKSVDKQNRQNELYRLIEAPGQ